MTAVDYRNQTTLITGASSGIGTEFARRIAARGSDVVLVARRRDRLEKLAAELDVKATVIPLDLSRPDAGQALSEEVADRGLRITSLINNAGFGTHGPFHSEDPQRLTEELNVNIASLVGISRAFIEPLRSAGTGVLVNVASLAAYQSSPNMAVYAATKAFVLSFTEALWGEARGTGLRVLALSPGLTRTEFFDVVGTDVMAQRATFQTPGEVAGFGLRVLDRRNPPPSAVSGRLNRVLSTGSRLLTRRRTVVVSGLLTG
jgi:uncharacterized protein